MKIAILVISAIMLFVLAIFALNSGIIEIRSMDTLQVLAWNLGLIDSAPNQTALHLINEVRFPRILGAIAVGGALALSGCLYQGIFTNPLVSPGILGVMQGASFGAALGMIWRLSYIGIEALCFVFAIISMTVAVGLAWLFSRNRGILMLILGGIVSSSLFGGLVSIMKYIADPEEILPNIVFWLMGSLTHIQKGGLYIALVVFVIGIIVSFAYSKQIDILCLGEDEANSIGVNVKKTRLLFIIIATLLAASSVSIAGVIGWIGLVIPHIGRFVIGANHRYLVPFCAIFGALLLLFIDTINRIFFSVEIPIGILTSVVGVPIFIIILFTYKNTIR